VTDWKLEQLPKFVTMQRPSDQVAVEITGNTRLFHGAVATHASAWFRSTQTGCRWLRVGSRSPIPTMPLALRSPASHRRNHQPREPETPGV